MHPREHKINVPLHEPKKPVMMKKCVMYMLLIQFLGWSCQKDEGTDLRSVGTLTLRIGLFVSVNDVNENLKSTLGTEDFRVVIFNAAGLAVRTFDRAADMPAVIPLEAGSYYAEASFGTDPAAAFESPYYFGRSAAFVITPGGDQSVVVNCQLANTVVTVLYSDNVRSAFSNYTTTVSSSAGSLEYMRTETRAGYFRPLPLSIRATLTWVRTDGSVATRLLTGSIPAPEARRRYEIHVDAAGASGSSALTVNVDETLDITEVVTLTESADTPASGWTAGDLILTEIMFDPSALTDANGEWFEVYNTTNQAVDLNNLVIDKNGTERHVIASGVTVAPHGYQVLSRTDAAVTASGYVYGSSISLTNSGATLSLSTYGTTGTDGFVICSVNYGSTGFPSATGGSICLDPDRLNGTEAVLGSSWCAAVTPYGTGDLGTPGMVNDNCD